MKSTDNTPANLKFKVESLKFQILSFRFLLFTLCFLFSALHSFAQDSIVVKGQFIGNTKYAKVLMKKFDIGNFPVGGAAIKEERFALTLPPDIPPGVYRFQYAIGEGEKYLDLIINGKEKVIEFALEANNEMALPVFLSSNENKLWYAYLAQNSSQLDRISMLNQFINAYPNANADIVKAAEKEWELEKTLYFIQLEGFKSAMKGTWAYEMVAALIFLPTLKRTLVFKTLRRENIFGMALTPITPN
jgi:hypothetical protein